MTESPFRAQRKAYSFRRARKVWLSRQDPLFSQREISLTNFKLTIEYDGRRFCGWQSQGQKNSIQEIIEKALCQVLREKIRLIASGRTDAGVHALAQVVNFKTAKKIPPEKLIAALNSYLPKDIAAVKIEKAAPVFHSRFKAKSKVYRYTILNRNFPSPLLKNFVYLCRFPLNLRLMREEAKVLVGRHDFKSFCASGCAARDTLRTVKRISVMKLNNQLLTMDKELNRGSLIAIEIEADGFLYNMIRNIAGTLIEIGRGRFKPGSMKKILKAKNRRVAGPTLPAKGLCLVRVNY